MNQMNGFNQNPQGNDNNFVLNFQPNDILQKEFKTKMRGYDPTEVDQFLDGIIKDYEAYSNELNRLQSENESLQTQLGAKGQQPQPKQAQQQMPKNRVSRPQPQVKNQAASSATAESSTNYDILRRISNLENRVFGHDFSNGLPDESNHEVKQFASAAVPNNMAGNGVESGHNEINPRMQPQQSPINNQQQGFNDPNHFQSNRQGQNINGFNGNNGNMNNNGNFNQF